MKRELLFVDVETSGLDPRKHAVLSLAAVAWRAGCLLEPLQVFIYTPGTSYDARSMEINGIDRRWLRTHGRSPGEAVDALQHYVAQSFGDMSDVGKVVLAGHNVAFDISFLKTLYAMSAVSYHDTFSHRSVDTFSIMSFLAMAGIIKSFTPTSSDAFAHFGIKMAEGSRHTALGDCLATAELFGRLLEMMRKKH